MWCLMAGCTKKGIWVGSVDHSMTYLLYIFSPIDVSRRTSCFIVLNLDHCLSFDRDYLLCGLRSLIDHIKHGERLHSLPTQQTHSRIIYLNIHAEHDNVPCCRHWACCSRNSTWLFQVWITVGWQAYQQCQDESLWFQVWLKGGSWRHDEHQSCWLFVSTHFRSSAFRQVFEYRKTTFLYRSMLNAYPSINCKLN